jgi:hypothetical protein
MILFSAPDEKLLRRFALELENIGRTVMVKASRTAGAYEGMITDILILPVPEFYRKQFMTFYRLNAYNGVKALKDLQKNFPYAPDYELDIGFVISDLQAGGDPGKNRVCSRGEIELSTRSCEKI